MEFTKALVLDGGGVVFNEPIPALLRALGGDQEKLQQQYDDLFVDFWSGRVSRENFWRALIRTSKSPGSPEYWEQFLQNEFKRGPAYQKLSIWSQSAHLYLLSNHRSVWARPLLTETEELFQKIWISEEIGIAKPNIEIFRLASREIPEDDLLFVDDRPDNIEAAKSIGIPALLAQGDAWIQGIDKWLSGSCDPK